ncbi:MAG: hypothetical protein CVU01_03295 [Bacteroidetes bacterium HGW-Bacteroidetes-18]|nr:MAG: hypothetical protein CVU01_03295 [Bacteroidetes bacterium HGW-Bacteroidetes-18]
MDEKAENAEKKEPIWNHLQELLNRLKIILLSVIVVSVFKISSSIFCFKSSVSIYNFFDDLTSQLEIGKGLLSIGMNFPKIVKNERIIGDLTFN